MIMMESTENVCLVDGKEVKEGYKELKENGQQKDYLVLTPKERESGFIRPLRYTYIHIGSQPKYPIRDLTAEEKNRFLHMPPYVKFEAYPGQKGSICTGRYWTQEQLDNTGCHQSTKMAPAIAETYAKDPTFYDGTFCVHCKKHLPVTEFVWEADGNTVGS